MNRFKKILKVKIKGPDLDPTASNLECQPAHFIEGVRRGQPQGVCDDLHLAAIPRIIKNTTRNIEQHMKERNMHEIISFKCDDVEEINRQLQKRGLDATDVISIVEDSFAMKVLGKQGHWYEVFCRSKKPGVRLYNFPKKEL